MTENNINKALEKEPKQAPIYKDQIINKSLKLETVNEGSNEDDVLVRGSDKTVKFVPRSEFETEGGSQNLQQTLDNGNYADIDGGNSFVQFLSGTSNNRVTILRNENDTQGSDLTLTTEQVLFSNSKDDGNIGQFGVNNGIVSFKQSNYINGKTSLVTFANPVLLDWQSATYQIPAKPAGTYTLATLDDIKSPQNLDQILANGNISSRLFTLNDGSGQSVISPGSVQLYNPSGLVNISTLGTEISSGNKVSRLFSDSLTFDDSGNTITLVKQPATGQFRLTLPAKFGTIATTQDLPLMINSNAAPTSATATGVKGDIRIDNDYLYVCVNTNTWKRSPLTTW
ncbi:hypothetical protein JI750_07605 [Flavobacterium sp. GN10]|uniref:Uncharacterized protein n=1 Tax=Flavobacterium tagetis TaxID=2801336 RepID=A0ABS1KBC6_9FLAO|nr:hypothetical protein [Flavobacterium tagetis]MBL0736743.1 hypothetical protein [Flavobacterium tagetis]